jgi:hypothetical protein
MTHHRDRAAQAPMAQLVVCDEIRTLPGSQAVHRQGGGPAGADVLAGGNAIPMIGIEKAAVVSICTGSPFDR